MLRILPKQFNTIRKSIVIISCSCKKFNSRSMALAYHREAKGIVSLSKKPRISNRILVNPLIMPASILSRGSDAQWKEFSDGLFKPDPRFASWQRFLKIVPTKCALKLRPVHFQLLLWKDSKLHQVKTVMEVINSLNVKKDVELNAKLIDVYCNNGYNSIYPVKSSL